MRELVDRTLGGWRAAPGQPAQPPPVPNSPLPPPPPGRVFLVDRPGMTQVPAHCWQLEVPLSTMNSTASLQAGLVHCIQGRRGLQR